jgi:hypothetical protein
MPKRKRRANVWTGGQPLPEGCQETADALPAFAAPAPLRRAAHIEYYWGETRFSIWATACSVREAPWGEEPMAWLFCRAMTVQEIVPDEPTGLITALIPAPYVTAIKPGPTFRSRGSLEVGEVGVFPPIHPAPEYVLPLEEVERTLVELLTPERN